MPLYDLSEFFRLSSALNYNLSAESLNRYNVLMFIIDGKRLHPQDDTDREHKGIMMEALSYIFGAYRRKRRRLGPLAVLHPLRAAALYVRAMPAPDLLELLTMLFHDILEDIRPTDFENPYWRNLEEQLNDILERVGPTADADLVSRLLCLTRREDESYYHYIGRLLETDCRPSDLVCSKLADRLDNTLDMRIDLRDPLEGIDFYETLFQLMFVKTYEGYRPDVNHPPPAAISGARRLYQLFKNAVLLSLIRQKLVIERDDAVSTLFNAVCEASLKEAQRNFIHVAGYHHTELKSQRALLLDAMDYCYSGKSERVTKPDSHQLLDGLFSTYFGAMSKGVRNRQLDALYQNKSLMMQASIAFIVIFLSFLNDPTFYVRGISSKGIEPN